MANSENFGASDVGEAMDITAVEVIPGAVLDTPRQWVAPAITKLCTAQALYQCRASLQLEF